MSLLDKASLIVTPNAYKTSKLYSVVPSTGTGDMDVVRDTIATRVNSLGLIESVGNNIPRLDYSNGSCPTLLVEPQRTNLVFPSATLTTQTRTVTAAPNTLSFYGTGTIVLSGVHIATLTGTGANNRVSLTFTPTAGSLILTVTGTVINAQLEAGSYATSYIPTVASNVTRNVDVISKTGISSLIGQTEGTIFIDFYYNTNLGISDSFLVFIGNNNNSASNAVYIDYVNGTFRFVVHGGSLTFFTQTTATLGRKKLALSYKSGKHTAYINGTILSSNTSINTPPLCDSFKVNNVKSSVGALLNNVNSAQVYKTQLTDAECIALTTL